MRWSLPVGRVFGISLRLHVTFLMLLAWVGFEAFGVGGLAAAKWELLRVGLIFVCIALHELGHSVVAQQLGVQVKSITLLPIGGVASLRSLPENPWHEIAITIAGPMVNAAIAAVLLPIAGFPALADLARIPHDLGGLLRALVGANIILFVFNFIPAFPMDGGRLLRAVLALVLPYVRATAIAAFVGQGLAIVFVLAGLKTGQWLLMIIGVFIFLGAEGEEKMVKMRSLLRDLDVEDVMTREFAALAPTDSVARGLEMVYQTGQDNFPVMDGDRLLGMVSRQDLLAAVNRHGMHTAVANVMEVNVPAVPPLAKVSRVQDELFPEGWGSLPVMQDGRLIGLLSPDNITRYILVQTSLKSARRRGAARTPAPPPVIGAVPPIVPPPPRAESVPPAGRA
jgi:Zn-dependent protease/predicted transcriptional regulator